MSNPSNGLELIVSAEAANAMIARMALSGFGMLAGLDVDLISDLCVVVNEGFDCLTHQSLCPRRICLSAWVADKRLYVRFEALDRICPGDTSPLDMDITRGVLETLMPEIKLNADKDGVSALECSMPI